MSKDNQNNNKKKTQKEDELVYEADEVVQTDCKELEEKLRKTKEELKKAKNHSVELISQIQRLKIDLANIKQGNEQELERLKEKLKMDLAKNLLQVFDTLEIAVKTEAKEEFVKEGIENALKQIKSVFENLGFEIYGNIGDEFDPNFYEAISSKEAKDEAKKHKVAEVMQAGLKIGKQVLRPARVVVYS